MWALSPSTLVFFGLAALVVGCAAGVAFSRNILHAALMLLGTLAGTAGLYLFIGADFLGVVQLLIYVGGILVLLLFAVLLTNRVGDVKLSNQSLGLPIAVSATTVLTGALLYGTLRMPWRLAEAVSAPTTARIGEAFLAESLLPFELASLILLMALLGAMVLARRATKQPTP